MYNWKASVPYGWLRLKPSNSFKHVREMNQHGNTLEFLNETQKYIHLISHPKLVDAPKSSPPRVITASGSPVRSSPSKIGLSQRSPEKTRKSQEEDYRLFDMLHNNRPSLRDSPDDRKASRSVNLRKSRLKKSHTEEKLSRCEVFNDSPDQVFLSQRKFRRAPLRLTNKSIQAFLQRFSKPKTASKLVFKPKSPIDREGKPDTEGNKTTLRLSRVLK